ncbi:synaptophysin-like isoform X1 [Argiope bruennichi]|uniref:synaptophysin-like isoform X1 n=2 Tax=Argiope bruennichi TaxID=94029 RepID=UPI002493EC1A|nr:synaptophysin-like isoform X1 [Argiope bruennichi]
MVIEVSKELDVVRIGIDRYSLKTGVRLRTIMDISLRVIKEPRGFIRIIQCLMAILAFSTTVGFVTECAFTITCGDTKENEIKIAYNFGYPFANAVLHIPDDCSQDLVKMVLPINYSSAAKFFVATGVLSFLYTIGIMIVYIFLHQAYTDNTKLPVVDLGITAVLSVFWMAGSSAWAQGVTDLKYYIHPDTLFTFFSICKKNTCQTVEDGSYGVLNGSLILGFANFLLWTSSLWFVYKETVFHSSEVPSQPPQSQATKSGVGRV